MNPNTVETGGMFWQLASGEYFGCWNYKAEREKENQDGLGDSGKRTRYLSFANALRKTI